MNGDLFYDLDKIITSRYTYALEHFLYKYTGQAPDDAGCSDFFAEEGYSPLNIRFDTTNTSENDDGRLLMGVCTRIGADNDRALVFCVISAKEIQDSLAIVGGEGITYYLLDRQKEIPLLVWGDTPKGDIERIRSASQWKAVSGIEQKVLYHIESDHPGLSLMAYISGDSMQSNLIKWAAGMQWLLIITVIILLLICFAAIILSYKPMYELVSEIDYSGGNEFDVIRNTLGDKDLMIEEQKMLILNLLTNHLIYGVPISKERIKQLGVGEDLGHYCVFLVEGYFFASSLVKSLTSEMEENEHTHIFITDWQEEKCSVIITFLKEDDISGLQDKLSAWLEENYPGECSLYTGKVVDKLENIQASFRSCLGQMKKKNSQKQKADADTLTPKEEQQKKMKEEILAYLEVHYRDSDLSQV